jgi:hypothetical protein
MRCLSASSSLGCCRCYALLHCMCGPASCPCILINFRNCNLDHQTTFCLEHCSIGRLYNPFTGGVNINQTMNCRYCYWCCHQNIVLAAEFWCNCVNYRYGRLWSGLNCSCSPYSKGGAAIG